MTSKNCWQYILARQSERGRLSRQMSLPNGGLSDWDRVTMASKAASATKCANYRNAITKGDATLPPRKNNKAKLLSDESSSSGSNNGANNNVTTMWQLLPIFSNKESQKEAKNNKEKKPKQKLPQKIKRWCVDGIKHVQQIRDTPVEKLDNNLQCHVCVRGRELSGGMTAISHAHTAQPAAKQLENTQLLKSSSSK